MGEYWLRDYIFLLYLICYYLCKRKKGKLYYKKEIINSIFVATV